MTLKQFISSLEGYFGEKYSGILLSAMTEYLANASPDFLQVAFKVLIKRCSRSFGKVPGIYEIETNLDEIRSLIPKPIALPEPLPELSDAERSEGIIMLREFKKSLRGEPGPMVKPLIDTIERIEGVLDDRRENEGQ